MRIFKSAWFQRFARQEKIEKEYLSFEDKQIAQLIENTALEEVVDSQEGDEENDK